MTVSPQGRQGQPSAVILDGCTLQSTCESGPRAGYDGCKRKRRSKVHMAVDMLGHLLASPSRAMSLAPAYEHWEVPILAEAGSPPSARTPSKAG